MSEPVPQQPAPEQPGLTGLPEGATVTGISQPEQPVAQDAAVDPTAQNLQQAASVATAEAQTGTKLVTVIHTHAPGIPYGPFIDGVWFPNKTAVQVEADLAAKVLELPGFTLADASELAPVRQP